MMNLAMAYVYEAAGGSVSILLAAYPVTYFVENLYRLQIIYGKKGCQQKRGGRQYQIDQRQQTGVGAFFPAEAGIGENSGQNQKQIEQRQPGKTQGENRQQHSYGAEAPAAEPPPYAGASFFPLPFGAVLRQR